MAVNVYARSVPVRPTPTSPARAVPVVPVGQRPAPPRPQRGEPPLVAGPPPPPAPAKQRHCVVCGFPSVRLTCGGCGEPVCADRVECCVDPKAQPVLCTHCNAVDEPRWGEW